MPLIPAPTGPIAPGSQFPQVLYGPNGEVVTVWTAADVTTAQQAGFTTTPNPGFDYGWMRDDMETSFPTFNYSSIQKAIVLGVGAILMLATLKVTVDREND